MTLIERHQEEGQRSYDSLLGTQLYLLQPLQRTRSAQSSLAHASLHPSMLCSSLPSPLPSAEVAPTATANYWFPAWLPLSLPTVPLHPHDLHPFQLPSGSRSYLIHTLTLLNFFSFFSAGPKELPIPSSRAQLRYPPPPCSQELRPVSLFSLFTGTPIWSVFPDYSAELDYHLSTILGLALRFSSTDFYTYHILLSAQATGHLHQFN